MRLYYLEMKRLIRTKSVWILMIAMVTLAAVMAYVPVTFIRAYKNDGGNVQTVTGVQAVKIAKEMRKNMEAVDVKEEDAAAFYEKYREDGNRRLLHDVSVSGDVCVYRHRVTGVCGRISDRC